MYTPQNITILLITLASFFPLYGQNKDNDQDLELVKVASLNTIEANKEFQKNVQLVQQQRALAVQILSKLEKVQDKDEHDELQKQLNSLQKKLNDNNQLMFKTYGFTLNRNYVLTVEKAHVHMWVTKEEAAAIKSKSDSDSPSKSEKKEGLRSLFKGKK
jgi:flagellar biosynthesis component FlhA